MSGGRVAERPRAGRPRVGAAALLALLAGAAGALGEDSMTHEYVQFESHGGMGIQEVGSGRLIVPARYDFASLPAGGRVRVELDGRVAWLDLEGRERIPFSDGWEAGSDFSEGLAAARRDGLWGYVDDEGAVVIEPRFHFAEPFHDGRAVIRNGDGDDSYIDRAGERITNLWFDHAEPFRDGYAVVGTVREHRQRLGILRRDGELVLEIAYYRIRNAGGGRLTVLRREGSETYPRYTEGVFVDGRGITWNDNMAPVNAMVRRAEAFVPRFEALLDGWLVDGCPCRHPRFRALVLGSPERESLFTIARDRFLDETGGERDVKQYSCRVCGSRYRATWFEYSIAAQGWDYELVELTVEEEGAEVVRPVPFLRFKTGYELRDQSRFREVEDVDLVLDYLARPRDRD